MEKASALKLISKTELINFPSASSIEFHNGTLYVIGDDARNLAILDASYKLIDTVPLFPGNELRIPKKVKADLEASTIIKQNNKDVLLVAGSASKAEREYLWLFPLDDLKNHEKVSTKAFASKMLSAGLKQVNVEGLAAVKNMLVFGNRGNNEIPNNQLIIVPVEELNALEDASPVIIQLDLGDDVFKGLSGLAYVESLDLLLFTASIEHTGNAFEDGAIGNSYLGYVKDFSSKWDQQKLQPDELLNLPQLQAEFRKEKIESVAVESVGDDLILHLVADNDNGTSTLFKLSFPNPLK